MPDNNNSKSLHDSYMESFSAVSNVAATDLRQKAFQHKNNSNKSSSSNFKSFVFRNSEEQLTLKTANELGYKYADLRKANPDDDTLKIISREQANTYKVIPIALKNNFFYLGISEPKQEGLIDFITHQNTKYNVVLALISKSSFLENIARYDSFNQNVEEKIAQGTIVVNLEKVSNLEDLATILQNDQIQNLLSDLLSSALKTKCSDIHIEPHGKYTQIRFRIDGILHQVAQISNERYRYLLSKIIIGSALQLDVDRPQNGRLKTVFGENNSNEVDIRVETLPVLHGQEVVMRLFHREARLLKIEELGINKAVYPIIKDILFRPHGMIIVVGPTGSGKTSTLYALLNELHKPERKIITLEDPVEYELPGISQSQINHKESFVDRFRAVLREDPDILMIGEIRDLDSAKTALQSALTGHLLLTTFHANNASIAIARLIDLVGDTSLISSAVNLIVAQRLVRKICPFCRKEHRLTKEEDDIVQEIIEKIPAIIKNQIKDLKFYYGQGCDRCFGVGFKGRIGIFEMLKVTTDIQQLIVKKSLPSIIQSVAVKNGMLTMEQDGMIKALSGLTTVSEVLTTVKES